MWPSPDQWGQGPRSGPDEVASAPVSVAVVVCTHRRNGPLERLLTSVHVAADRVRTAARVEVVVIDDNPNGQARCVVQQFDQAFPGQVHYRHVGSENISIARNAGVETALAHVDWIAMTDDDQVVDPGWLQALLETQRRTGADAVSGPVFLRYPDESPQWLYSQPFHRILEAETHPDGAAVQRCSTGNTLLRSDFLQRHPEIRFRPELGTIGGEDMVFFTEANRAGLVAHYGAQAICYAMQPPERSTYGFQLRSCYWMGNTEYVTNHVTGEAGRFRLGLRATRRMAEAVWHPARRMSRAESPQWRFTFASIARATGMLMGVVGVEVAHR